MLVEVRTLALHHIQGQLMKLPTDVRDLLSTSGKIEARLRRLECLDPGISTSTMAGDYRIGWLVEYIEQDRDARRRVRQLERDIDRLLDEHGTTLRDESGVGPIAAATLLVEVGDPFRFSRESKLPTALSGHGSAISSAEWIQSSSASRSNRQPRNRQEPGTTFLPSSRGQTLAGFVPNPASEILLAKNPQPSVGHRRRPTVRQDIAQSGYEPSHRKAHRTGCPQPGGKRLLAARSDTIGPPHWFLLISPHSLSLAPHEPDGDMDQS